MCQQCRDEADRRYAREQADAPVVYASDVAEMEAGIAKWEGELENFIGEFLGQRCSAYSEGFIVCEKWNAFDLLCGNPWKEKE